MLGMHAQRPILHADTLGAGWLCKGCQGARLDHDAAGGAHAAARGVRLAIEALRVVQEFFHHAEVACLHPPPAHSNAVDYPSPPPAGCGCQPQERCMQYAKFSK